MGDNTQVFFRMEFLSYIFGQINLYFLFFVWMYEKNGFEKLGIYSLLFIELV